MGPLPLGLQPGATGYCSPWRCWRSAGQRAWELLLGPLEAAQASQLKNRYHTLYLRVWFPLIRQNSAKSQLFIVPSPLVTRSD